MSYGFLTPAVQGLPCHPWLRFCLIHRNWLQFELCIASMRSHSDLDIEMTHVKMPVLEHIIVKYVNAPCQHTMLHICELWICGRPHVLERRIDITNAFVECPNDSFILFC